MDQTIQFFIILLGGLFIYAGVFIYPDERKNLHNRIEDIWLNISIKENEFSGVIQSSAKASAKLFSKIFNHLFGEELVSKQSIMTSTVLSAWLSPMVAAFAAAIYFIITLAKDIGSRDLVISIVAVSLLFFLWLIYVIKGVTREKFRESYQKSKLGFIGNLSVFIVVGPASVALVVFLEKGQVSTGNIYIALFF